jgi:hypothetical protein
MSVTPTDSALIVALDFEGPVVSHATLICVGLIQLLLGVHSIERSAQEDTLLVLFNTAISNLVCIPPFTHIPSKDFVQGSFPEQLCNVS